MINARTKGNQGERDWRTILNKKFGTRYERTPLSGGMDLKGDVRKAFGSKPSIIDEYHWEVKRVEKINIHNCFHQAVRDARNNTTPVVAFRKNSDQWKICIDAEDFLNILLELEELRGDY